MKSIDILEAIGNADEEYVIKARAKRKSRKALWIALGSSAACLALFVAAPLIFAASMRAGAPDPGVANNGAYSETSGVGVAASRGGSSAETASVGMAGSRGGNASESTEQQSETPRENLTEVAPLIDDVQIYYVSDGEVLSKTRTMRYDPEIIFAAWREENGIGEEVRLIAHEIEDNGTTTKKEVAGVSLVKCHSGDYFIYNLTVSKNLEDYYDRIDSELLLESLKQTMLGYLSMEFDEYHLTLE